MANDQLKNKYPLPAGVTDEIVSDALARTHDDPHDVTMRWFDSAKDTHGLNCEVGHYVDTVVNGELGLWDALTAAVTFGMEVGYAAAVAADKADASVRPN
jgi:hypothetical protein